MKSYALRIGFPGEIAEGDITDKKWNKRAVRDLYDVIWNDQPLDRFDDVFAEVRVHSDLADWIDAQ